MACENCHSNKTKQRSEKEYKALINRLNRIEGQIRGIKGMLEKNAYCTDILVQVSAVNAALNSLIKSCLQIISKPVWRRIFATVKTKQLTTLSQPCKSL